MKGDQKDDLRREMALLSTVDVAGLLLYDSAD